MKNTRMAPLNGLISQSCLVPKAFYENGFTIVVPSSSHRRSIVDPPFSSPTRQNPHLFDANCQAKSPKGSIDPPMPLMPWALSLISYDCTRARRMPAVSTPPPRKAFLSRRLECLCLFFDPCWIPIPRNGPVICLATPPVYLPILHRSLSLGLESREDAERG